MKNIKVSKYTKLEKCSKNNRTRSHIKLVRYYVDVKITSPQRKMEL